MKDNLIPFTVPKSFAPSTDNKSAETVMSIAECRNRFIDFKRNTKGLSERTCNAYEGEINRLIRFLPRGPLTPIKEVTKEIIAKYIGYANKTKRKWEDHKFNNSTNTSQIGLKGTTVNNMRRYLSTFFKWLVKRRLVTQNPISFTEKVPEYETGYGYALEQNEVFRLTQVLKQDKFNGYRDLALIQVLVDSAMRIGQVLQLRVDDILLEQNLIHVRPEISKRKKGRYAPITPGTAYMLGILIRSMEEITTNDFPWLWITEQGTKLTGSTFSKQLKRYAKQAGLEISRVHPHAFRSYSAIEHHRNGAAIDEIQVLLEHKDITTTMIYLEKSQPDLRSINEKYSPAHELFKKPGRKSGPKRIELLKGAEVSFSENIL